MKRVLIAGATGYLGRYLVSEFHRRGYRVRALTRSHERLGPVRTSVDEVHLGEATRPATLAGVTRGIDVVVSALGITRQKDGLTYADVDYRGNLHLLEDARAHGAGKFLYVSALAPEGADRLRIMQAKNRFAAALGESGLDHVVVRPNGYFSDIREFLVMAARGTTYVFGDGGFRMNPIHGRDLAAVCADAVEGGPADLAVGGPVVYTHREIAEEAFTALGRKPRIRRVPVFLGRGLTRALRVLTPVRIHGPIEFLVTVLTHDMIAPRAGKEGLPAFFAEEAKHLDA